MGRFTLDPTPPVGTSAQWETAWAVALTELELDVARAESLLASAEPTRALEVRPDWAAPVLAGPLPERLRARAEAIAARQLHVAEGLSRAIATARRELRLAERIQDHTLDRSRPAFLDASF